MCFTFVWGCPGQPALIGAVVGENESKTVDFGIALVFNQPAVRIGYYIYLML